MDPLAANTRHNYPGYRNREDVAVLNPDVMVVGSKNVLTNTFKRIGSRKGYVLDGQRSTPNSGQGIYGSFDWKRHTGDERNFRSGFNSTGTNGIVQFRYVATAGDKYKANTFTQGQVYWIDLHTGAGTSYNACRFWDFNNELKDLKLWVDGTSNIFMWSGAVNTLKAVSWATGSVSVLNATPTAGGAGYVVGDVLTITTGGTGATARVDAVGGGGAVTVVTQLTPGSGYTTGAGKVTSGGSGAGCTLNITTIAQGYIQVNGATAGAQGFLSSGAYTQAVTINSTSYTYSKIVDTYLVGLSADPTAEPLQSVVFQTAVTTPNSGITGIPATFKNYIIENLNNQIYLSASDNNSVYVSNVSNYKSFAFSSPRKPSEGAILTFDGVPTCLQQQSDSMFISAGKNYWYLTKFTLSSDNMSESLNIIPIKTTANQACVADALSTKIKNLIAFVSHETQINTIGISANFYDEPQVSDLSFPIVQDVQDTDFTGGQMLYFKKYLIVTAPAVGKMFIYNMTQDITDGLVDSPGQHYWEAPQTLPFGRLSIIDGELYGHMANESNTFKLFTGLDDDGKPYQCVALFAYDVYGNRVATKSSQQLFIEGYKYQDTALKAMLRRGLNGPVVSWSFKKLPDRCLIPIVDDASIGKASIGKTPIGGTLNEIDTSIPPKFRLIQTYNRDPFFEEQVGFSSDGKGQWWEIVSHSTDATLTPEGQSSIKDPNEGAIN